MAKSEGDKLRRALSRAANRYWVAAGRTGLAHYHAGARYARLHWNLGVPNVLLSAVVATAVFGTIQEAAHAEPTVSGARIATGVAAVLAAGLTAVSTFLNYSDRSEKDKAAGARYGSVRRQLDVLVLRWRATPAAELEARREECLAEVEEIAQLLNDLAAEAPSLPQGVYDDASAEFDASHEPPFREPSPA